jgi:hypothetical protein
LEQFALRIKAYSSKKLQSMPGCILSFKRGKKALILIYNPEGDLSFIALSSSVKIHIKSREIRLRCRCERGACMYEG